MKGNRYFLLSLLFGVLAFVLGWVLKDASPFTAVGTVALGGGHLTNSIERWKSQPTEAQ